MWWMSTHTSSFGQPTPDEQDKDCYDLDYYCLPSHVWMSTHTSSFGQPTPDEQDKDSYYDY